MIRLPVVYHPSTMSSTIPLLSIKGPSTPSTMQEICEARIRGLVRVAFTSAPCVTGGSLRDEGSRVDGPCGRRAERVDGVGSRGVDEQRVLVREYKVCFNTCMNNAEKLTKEQADAKFGKRFESGDRVSLPGGYFGTVVANNSLRGVEVLVDGGTTLFVRPSVFQRVAEVAS